MITLNLPISRGVMRLMLLLLFAGVGSAMFAAKDTVAIPFDSSAIELRTPDPSMQEDIYADDEWKYITEAPKADKEKSFFDRLLDNILKSLFDQMSSSSADGDPSGGTNWWTIFFIILGVGLIVFFVIKATGTGGNLLFKGKSQRKEKVDASLEDVDIHAIDYDAEIAAAKTKNDYRLAVRLWFLRSLKDMTDRELIKWKMDKTNSDYYYELSGNKLQKEFGAVSLVYDYVWYGDFEINELKYNSVEGDLRKFYSNVKETQAKK